MDNINIPMAKVGFELWIWNGKDATKSMSREEVVTVILKTMEKFEKGEVNGYKIGELFGEVS